MVTEVRPEQSENASHPMLFTLLPSITSLIDLNPLNQEPTVLQCRVTEVRPEQSENASYPMLVTLLGMVTEVRLEQLAKAYLPILVTPSGITKFVISVFSSL